MRHLSQAEWDDLVEAGDDAPVHAHLVACPSCRDDVAAARALLRDAKLDGVPEPSPLFWDHLSSRVAAEIDRDRVPRSSSRSWWRVLVPLVAGVGALVFVVAIGSRRAAPGSVPPPAPRPAVESSLTSGTDDGGWQTLGHMASGMDVGTLSDSLGRSPAVGTEAVVWQLNDRERVELAHLLSTELRSSPAGVEVP